MKLTSVLWSDTRMHSGDAFFAYSLRSLKNCVSALRELVPMNQAPIFYSCEEVRVWAGIERL